MNNQQDFVLTELEVTVSAPKPIKMHVVEEKDLEALMKATAPRSLVVGASCISYAIGDMRGTLEAVLNGPPNMQDILFFGLFCLSIGIGAVTLIYGLLCKSDSYKMLEEMKKREFFVVNKNPS